MADSQLWGRLHVHNLTLSLLCACVGAVCATLTKIEAADLRFWVGVAAGGAVTSALVGVGCLIAWDRAFKRENHP